MPRIHPTAVVDPSAKLADDVEVGPYCIIEADTSIGPACRLMAHATIRRYTSMGAGNMVDSHAVLGGLPQDLKFDPATATGLVIGDGNVFRECVTISRATRPGHATRVGNNTYWMVYSHAGHDSTVNDNAILVNGSAIAGHVVVGRRVFLSAHVSVHQYCWIGELVMTQGNCIATVHVPPYCMIAGVNNVVGLNVVGLTRDQSISQEDRRQIKEAFQLTMRSGLTPSKALERMDACSDWGAAAGQFREFVRKVMSAEKPYNRGLCGMRERI